MEVSVDFNELLIRALKYIFEALCIVLVAWLLGITKKIEVMELAVLSATAACVFAILDTLSPTYQQSVRQGVGLASGFKMMGAF